MKNQMLKSIKEMSIMNDSSLKNLIGIPERPPKFLRHILLGCTLPLSLVLLPHSALGHNPVRGSQTQNSIVLDPFSLYTTLAQVTINVPNGIDPTHNCAVIASANVFNNTGIDNGSLTEDSSVHRYHFGIGLDFIAIDPSSLRVVERRNQADVNDPDRWPVSTNRTFSLSPGNHTFYFLGGPETDLGESPAITVNRRALSVICSHDTGA